MRECLQDASSGTVRARQFTLAALALALGFSGCVGATPGDAEGSGGSAQESGGGSGASAAGGDGGSDNALAGGTGGSANQGGGPPSGSGGATTGGNSGRGGSSNGNGGSSPPPSDAGVTNPDAPPANAVPTFVAVGYGGLRVRSTDLGKTWTDAQRLGGGGDDDFLLRTVAYGKGLFVAIGWQLHTSPDGKVWTKRTKSAGQWMGGVRFGNDMFVAAGGYGESTYSMDGITWPKGGGRNTDAARSVAFGNGLWMARADSGQWWQTSNGKTWTTMGGGHSGGVVYCGTQFTDARNCTMTVGRNDGRVAFGAGVWVGIRNGQIERSENNGTTWTTSAYKPSDGLEDVAFGYAVP